MKRLLVVLALLTFLFVAVPAFGQNSTAVTVGPITDAGGILWANGTWTLTFVGQPNSSWPGGALANSFSGNLSAAGSATQSTPSNATIQPSPSFWTLKVCPSPAVSSLPSGCVSQQFTISGGTQTISITPAAIVISVPTVSTSIPPVTAYADAEISGGWVGFQYYNITLASGRVCASISISVCTWASTGGGSVTSQQVASNLSTVYVSSNCGSQTNCFPVANTGRFDWQTTLANSSATVTTASTAPVFRCPGAVYPCSSAGTGSDIGYKIQATNASTPGYTSQNTSVLELPVSTITAIASAHVATASNTATAGAGTACAATNQVGCLVVWGPDESAALTTAFNAAITACGTLVLPGGNAYGDGPTAFLTNTALFNTASHSLSTSGTRATCSQGTEGARTGVVIRGQGIPSTFIIPTGDFSGASCTFGQSQAACFFTTWDGINVYDLSLFGAGLSNPSSMTTKVVAEVNPIAAFSNGSGNGFWDHVSFMNWGSGSAGIGTCVLVNGGAWVFGALNIDGCGIVGIQIGSSAGLGTSANTNTTIQNSTFFDNWQQNMLISNSNVASKTYVASVGNQFGFVGTATNSCDVSVQGAGAADAVLEDFGSNFGYNQGINNSIKQVGGLCVNYGSAGVTTGATAILHGSVAGIGAGNQTGSEGAFVQTGGVLHSCNATFNGTGTGTVYGLFNSGTFYDDCPNFITGTIAGVGGAGTVIGDASITGTAVIAANLVPSANFGVSAAVSALTGNTRFIQFTITNGASGTGANPTLAYTFPTPFFSTSNLVCSAFQVGGTQAITALTATWAPSSLSATGVTFTYNGTPSNSDTEIAQILCDNK